jgi:hypothetical protein
MHTNLAIGALLIILTSLVHTLLTGYLVHFIRKRVRVSTGASIVRAVLRINFVILLTIAATLVETAIWASSYLYIGALQEFEEALYFSIITYTTLGYGDITLGDQWRLLASIEAANGIIMFGWSTSLVILLVQNIGFTKNRNNG